MTDQTRIDELVDWTAALAAAFVPGVRSVYGVGSGKVTIPAGGVLAGEIVQAWKGKPSGSFEHVSDTPIGIVDYQTATNTVITWTIRQRLYFGEADEIEYRRHMIDLYAGYMNAYSQHIRMEGVLLSGAVRNLRFQPGLDADGWRYLGIDVGPLIERINLENVA